MLEIAKTKKNNIDVDLLPNNFFIGTRYVSNIVFPNKKIGDDGLESFTKMKIISDLDKYSTKFDAIMKKNKKVATKISPMHYHYLKNYRNQNSST